MSRVGAHESPALFLLCVVLLLALGWRERMRSARFAIALLACSAWSAPPSAQTGGLALDRFHAAPAGGDWLALDSLGMDRQLRWSTRLPALDPGAPTAGAARRRKPHAVSDSG